MINTKMNRGAIGPVTGFFIWDVLSTMFIEYDGYKPIPQNSLETTVNPLKVMHLNDFKGFQELWNTQKKYQIFFEAILSLLEDENFLEKIQLVSTRTESSIYSIIVQLVVEEIFNRFGLLDSNSPTAHKTRSKAQENLICIIQEEEFFRQTKFGFFINLVEMFSVVNQQAQTIRFEELAKCFFSSNPSWALKRFLFENSAHSKLFSQLVFLKSTRDDHKAGYGSDDRFDVFRRRAVRYERASYIVELYRSMPEEYASRAAELIQKIQELTGRNNPGISVLRGPVLQLHPVLNTEEETNQHQTNAIEDSSHQLVPQQSLFQRIRTTRTAPPERYEVGRMYRYRVLCRMFGLVASSGGIGSLSGSIMSSDHATSLTLAVLTLGFFLAALFSLCVISHYEARLGLQHQTSEDRIATQHRNL